MRSQLSIAVLGVQMGMSLMKRSVGQSCHNMPSQLAVLKAQGGDGNVWVVCINVCVLGWGVVGGCEEFPVELIIPTLTWETGGWAGSRGGGVGGGMLRL